MSLQRLEEIFARNVPVTEGADKQKNVFELNGNYS